MEQIVEITIDNQGKIFIPPILQKQLGLVPGMALMVEKEEDGQMCLIIPRSEAMLVDKQGILVVRSEAIGDLTDITQQERNFRLENLLDRTKP